MSLIPGCGQMFMGFLRRGISFTFYFICGIILTVVTRVALFAAPTVLIYIYAFFDSMQLNWIPDEQFQDMQDGYFIPNWMADQPMNARWISKAVGITLVLSGILFFVNTIGLTVFNTFEEYLPEGISNLIYNVAYLLPSIIFCVIAMIVGMRLIRGKKKEISQIESFSTDESAV